MKKKAIFVRTVVVIAVLFAIIGLTLFFTGGFTVGKITNRVYNTQNVYDEIWNLLLREEAGQETVLTCATANASKVYELGVFDYIRIPECHATLTNRTGDLRISINTGEFVTEEATGRTREKYVVYEYNYKTKTLRLSGTDSESYLADSFLSEYFKWQNVNTSKAKYSLENLGDYSVIMSDLGDYVLTRPVSE